MQLKSIKIRDIELKNNVFMAPIAGFSDFSFRSIAYELGAGLCFTELISSKGLIYNSIKTKDLLHKYSDDDKSAVQIFGNDPNIMRKACESYELERFKIVDINMGCPVLKLFKNNEGSALLQDIKLAESIIKSCVKSGKIITVKIRTGITEGQELTESFAKMCEQAGAELITIHGRVRENFYTGKINFEQIRKAKQSIKIPVIANGGIMNRKDAAKLQMETGADGIMLARGALYNPFLISKLTDTYTAYTKKSLILEQIDRLLTFYDSRQTAVIMRKRIAYYLKGKKDTKQHKQAVFECQNAEDLKTIVGQIFNG